ncbi:membrane-bound O-acyltransferase family protein [Flavobacterium faecale]|uniref:Membrane-bound O-acyltransferase family protein n=1 Tax=Flavobacterium faecale TaxID=1355330 RepID=A0A2S1LCH8_9FLAO|nr:MBOAT family O-acyltransferase [Flavobacterium faecale]AWG21463.1 membrane-bound O-acyltransferase family protein [Flavobacterium faecale]
MLFNSISFAFFLPIVFLLYWFVLGKSYKAQNAFLLLASYYFYSCWDIRFLALLLFSTGLDYFSALQIQESKSESSRKFWFWASIGINISFLGIFKYYNFFASSFQESLVLFGIQIDLYLLQIILPVGISFYTFHGLSYIIDVYKKKIIPEKDPLAYALFVSYFPLLVAGPIERATHLLPQLKRKRKFDYQQAVDGLYQILWGLLKKIVIADNCAKYANQIFDNAADFSGSTLVMGAIFFAFQIYGDFSGYSDIALGTSKLLGIELLQNFSFPYFSRDIAEFWRRWHISLSSWFKDYVYIPLGGSKGSKLNKIRNVFVIFLLSGFWHGANWTFIAWGFLHALYFIPLLLTNKNRSNIEIVANETFFPSIKELFQIGLTFSLTTLAWIFFRAPTIGGAIAYIKGICNLSLFTFPSVRPTYLIILIILFIIIEWMGRRSTFALGSFNQIGNRYFRWTFLLFLLILIFIFNSPIEQQFIYFQF